MKIKRSVLGKIVLGVLCILVFTACSGSSENTDINAPSDAKDLVGEDYESVVSDLKDAGFTTIKTKKIEDLVTGWLTKDGEVNKISINGVSDFSKGDKFPKDAKVTVSYHTFETKDSTSESKEQLFLKVSTEVQASKDNKVEIKGSTLPKAKVSIGMGILGDSVTADKDGKFTLKMELSTPEETAVEINSKLNGEKKSVEVTIVPDEKNAKKYREEQAKESSEQEVARASSESAEEEANQIITSDTPEFASILNDTSDSYDEYKKFVDKYKGRTIEFDGNISAMANHDDYKTRYNLLIYCGDYTEDGSTGMRGPSFQFRDINIVSGLKLTGDNIPDYIQAGLNLHIIAKIDGYDTGGDLILLEPVETRIR